MKRIIAALIAVTVFVGLTLWWTFPRASWSSEMDREARLLSRLCDHAESGWIDYREVRNRNNYIDGRGHFVFVRPTGIKMLFGQGFSVPVAYVGAYEFGAMDINDEIGIGFKCLRWDRHPDLERRLLDAVSSRAPDGAPAAFLMAKKETLDLSKEVAE